MYLPQIFQKYAGKVIRESEFVSALAQTGLNLEASAADVRSHQRVLARRGYDPTPAHPRVAWVEKSYVARLDAALAAAQDSEDAIMIADAVRWQAVASRDVYWKAETLLNRAAITYGQTNVLEAFARAADACKDYRSACRHGRLKNMYTATWAAVERFPSPY